MGFLFLLVRTEIKQEHEHEPTGLEALDFSILAELASKRPFEHVAQDNHDEREQEAKRPKTENPTTEEETSLEDGLALLVQNALSNVGDLVSKFNIETGDAHGSDPMDVDDAHGADARPAPVSFLSEPEKYVRIANTHALGNLVRQRDVLRSMRSAHQRINVIAGAFITTDITPAAHR